MSKDKDLINHPPHYTNHPSGIECIQVTEHMGFNLGNAVKYIWRCDLKKNAVEDLKKAIWYIQREINKRNGIPPAININYFTWIGNPEIALQCFHRNAIIGSIIKYSEGEKAVFYSIDECNKKLGEFPLEESAKQEVIARYLEKTT